MLSRVTRRIEILERRAPPVEPPEPHVLVFVNVDGTEASRLVLGRDWPNPDRPLVSRQSGNRVNAG